MSFLFLFFFFLFQILVKWYKNICLACMNRTFAIIFLSRLYVNRLKIAWSKQPFSSNITNFLIEVRWKISQARSETRKPRKSRKSRKFFSEIFKSKFSILAVGQIRKLRNKKTRDNFSEISDFFEFSIFSFFKKNYFFNILKYRNSRPQMFLKIVVLKNLAIFKGKHLCWSLFFNKISGLRPAVLFKKRL